MAPQPLGFERPTFENLRPGVIGPGASSRAGRGLAAFLELAADGWRVATRSLDPPEPAPRVVVEFGRDTCRILRDGVQTGPRLRPSDASAIARAAAAAMPERPKPGDVALGFADEIALDLALTLPKATRSVLDEAAAMHAADETPFSPGEGLAFWTIQRSGKNDAEVIITIVPSRAALAALDEMRALGIEPRHAVRRGKYVSFAASPGWLAAADAHPSSIAGWLAGLPAQVRTLLLAAGIVAGSCLANFGFTMFQSSLISDKASAAADAVRRDKRLGTDMQFLAARQREALAKLRVLDEVAARLPDTAYLERIEAKDDVLDLTALAPSAADTLKALSAIENVKSAELQSAVVRDQGRNLERFKLSLTVASQPARSKP